MKIIKERTFTHFSERKKPVDGILIHSIAQSLKGQEGDSIDFLERIGLSAHYFITPDGTPYETLSTDKVAYHAGKSAWKGQRGLNSTFIGIEVMVSGEHDWGSFKQTIKDPRAFSNAQYGTAGLICYRLIKSFPAITYDRVLMHSQVSGPDVREDPKIDPGKGWNQEKLMSGIRIRFSGMV